MKRPSGGALLDGRIAGAALDVLCDERSSGMKDHPLVAYARDARQSADHASYRRLHRSNRWQQTEEFLAEKVVSFLQSHPEEACVAGNAKGSRLICAEFLES